MDNPVNTLTPAMIDRFWAHVAVAGPDECWLWTGLVLKVGYGRFRDWRKPLPPSGATELTAHRVSWVVHNGPIPEGLFVCHTCDVRRCVNPGHLFVGTQGDNLRDMIAKGRRVYGNAKLTAEDVREIRRLYAAGGRTHGGLAMQFGVHRATIDRALNGRSWVLA